jgi:hypothetical protein
MARRQALNAIVDTFGAHTDVFFLYFGALVVAAPAKIHRQTYNFGLVPGLQQRLGSTSD